MYARSEEMVGLLLGAGADVSATSDRVDERTPLHSAARRAAMKGGGAGVVRALLDTGAAPNVLTTWT